MTDKKCNFGAGCKAGAEYIVIHKAVAAMPERAVISCRNCAAMIGSHSPEGSLINKPGMESQFYKVREI